MIKQYLLGHGIDYDWKNKKWFYVDNGELIKNTSNPPRPCIKCGNNVTKEGNDYCLGVLPNIKNACCGHGVVPLYTVKSSKTIPKEKI